MCVDIYVYVYNAGIEELLSFDCTGVWRPHGHMFSGPQSHLDLQMFVCSLTLY